MTLVSSELRPREPMSIERKARFLQIGLLVFAIGFWEIAMQTGLMAKLVSNPSFWFSSPSAIAALLWRLAMSGQLFQHVWLTFSATLIGLGIGAVLGIALGVITAQSARLEILLDPIWSALNALPKIALAPAFAASLGIGIASKSALAVAIVVFVFLFNTSAGLKAVDRTLVCNLRLMGASRMQILRMALLPSMVRWLYGALRISLGLALTAVVVGEFVAARGGIGFIIQYGFGMFNVTWCYAGIVLLGMIALATDTVMRLGEDYLTRWETSA